MEVKSSLAIPGQLRKADPQSTPLLHLLVHSIIRQFLPALSALLGEYLSALSVTDPTSPGYNIAPCLSGPTPTPKLIPETSFNTPKR